MNDSSVCRVCSGEPRGGRVCEQRRLQPHAAAHAHALVRAAPHAGAGRPRLAAAPVGRAHRDAVRRHQHG